MKRNISFLILISVFTVSKAQVKDSTKFEKTNVYSLKIANPTINKPLFFKENQNEGNDIQKNLNQLNSRFTVNPYQIPRTITNPNGVATPKQAIISGLLKGMTR
jgi:membrane-associated HD superfamily phosphohydrolase